MASGQGYTTPLQQGTPVPSAEQLRRMALARAESRGKWVAMRRLALRHVWHQLWTLLFPLLGLLLCLALVVAVTLNGMGFHINERVHSWLAEPVVAPTFNSLQLDRQLSESSLGALGTAQSNNQ